MHGLVAQWLSLGAFCLAFSLPQAMQLEVMVASRWLQRERRDIQRRAIRSCLELASTGHAVELLFFMGTLDESVRYSAAEADAESAQFGDMVVVGGPDSDPPVPRDATYVLERPCARTYRLASASAWLAQHRPQLDYVMYLDDDSFLHVPRLLGHLESRGSERLAMGFTMETNLDWSDTHICELCDPCKPCQLGSELQEFCAHFPDMAYGGCMMAVQNCKIFNDGEDIADCVLGKLAGIRRVAEYFGSKSAPRWLLGMGWVFGKRIVQYIGRNAKELKAPTSSA